MFCWSNIIAAGYKEPLTWSGVFVFEYIIEAAPQRCSEEKLFRKYAEDLQENTHAEAPLQKSCKETLLKSHLSMGVLW